MLILAAGLGKRLRPLTENTPKAMVEVGGRPMLDYSLELLAASGVQEVRINVHHCAKQIISYVEKVSKRFSFTISIQDESELLLGSGGAIAKAGDWLFAEANEALLWNPDALLFPDIGELRAFHVKELEQGAQATMMLMPHPDVGTRYNPVRFRDNRVTGFGSMDEPGDTQFLHFAGGYILQKECLDRLPPSGEVSCVVEKIWFPLARIGALAGWSYGGPYQDLGTPEDVGTGNERIASGEFSQYPGFKS